MGDALNALRPQRLRTKAASSLLPQMAGRLFVMQFLPPSRAIAHFGSANCPVAYQGLKIITSLWLRFPDFQRQNRTEQIQARHATSRNSGTPVAVIRSPTQRMGDALNALRPQRLRTKAASSLLPQMAGRLFGMQFLLLSRAASTRRISELPCRLSGTKNHHFAIAPFP